MCWIRRPRTYVAPDLEECWDEMMVAKIIYRSGRPTTLYPMTIPKGHTLDPEHPPGRGRCGSMAILNKAAPAGAAPIAQTQRATAAGVKGSPLAAEALL